MILRCLIVFLLSSYSLCAQSYFNSEDSVIDHLVGEWNLDYSSSWGITTDLRDSAQVVKFELSTIDSLPLICKTYQNGILVEEGMIEIIFDENDGFPGSWRLLGLPDFLAIHCGIPEETTGDYALSPTKMMLSMMAFDGILFSLTKDDSVSTNENLFNENFAVFPNPVFDKKINITKQSSQDFEMNLIDSRGRVIFNISLDQKETRVSIPQLTNGLYFVQFIGDNNSAFSSKLIVQN